MMNDTADTEHGARIRALAQALGSEAPEEASHANANASADRRVSPMTIMPSLREPLDDVMG